VSVDQLLDRRLARAPVRLAAVIAALAAVALMIRAGWTELLAWTDRLIPEWRYPWLFGGLVALYAAVMLAPPRARKPLLLIGSLAAMVWFDPRFAAGALVFLLAWYGVVFAPVHRWVKLGFLAATYAGLMAVSNLLWFPDLLLAHPWIVTLTYAFAVSFTFRLFYFFHEMKLKKFVRVPLDDFLLYFVFVPYWIIVPYMFAIPRFGQFAKGLVARDEKVETAGARYLVLGAATLAITYGLLQLYSPRDELMAAMRARDWATAAGAGLLYYPIQVVFEAIAVAWVLTGMVQLLGVDMKPAFVRPLGATSIHEWWRRWNIHFRDFLVDIFFYPLMIKWRKRNPYLTIIVGCAAVFLLGSTLFHWIGKYWFIVNSHDNFYASMSVENFLMFVAVAAGLCLEKRRMLKQPGHRPAKPPWPVAGARLLGTWVFLLAVVVFAGYGATWAAYHRPIEAQQGRLDRAVELAAKGERAAAAAEIAPALPVLERQARHLPREPLRRLQLALAHTLAGDRAAAAADLEIARAFGNLDDPHQASLWQAIDRLAPER
jgi:D-alanyl-lipoteichoic acid acyltransferase DltB (MBOAT superfamily)